MEGLKRRRETEVARATRTCIDPRLTLLDEMSGDSTSRTSLTTSATSESTSLQTPSFASGSTSGSEINDFGVALKTFGEDAGSIGISKLASDYLKVWRFHNGGRLPCRKHIKAFEGLTKTPGAALVRWLNEHPTSSNGSSASFQPRTVQKVKSFDVKRPYRARCLESSSRFGGQKHEASESETFHCTSRCGKTFRLKGDWSRHEKSNFEEWNCDLCTKVVTRKSHLQTHIKEQHNSESRVSTQQRRELFSSVQRPCGFCLQVLDSWLAWLGHIADHFEGTLPGGTKTMSDWVEKRDVQIRNITGHPPVTTQDGTADVDDTISYSYGYDAQNQLPPDTLGGLNNDSEIESPSRLDWIKKEAHCEECKLTGPKVLPAPDFTESLSTIFELARGAVGRGDIEGALSPAMAAMVVSKIKYGCRRKKQSDFSCCCNECEGQLDLKTPGIQTMPRIIGAGIAEPGNVGLVMLGEFLMQKNGPWTPFSIRRT